MHAEPGHLLSGPGEHRQHHQRPVEEEATHDSRAAQPRHREDSCRRVSATGGDSTVRSRRDRKDDDGDEFILRQQE